MAKSLKDILTGVKSSKIAPGSTGSDPGVDYAPKAPDEQEFVKKHKTEKHEDRVGNGDDVYQATNIKHSQVGEPAHGHKSPKDKAVYEAAKCNMTEEGTACPVHEMADCSKSKKTLREVASNPYAIGMAVAMNKKKDRPPLEKSTITKAHDIAKAIQKEDLAVPLLGGDDESAEMAKTQLRALANKALHLAMQLNDDQMVEPWVQSKIAVAKEYVSAVHDYMVYGDHDKETEKEQTAPYDGGIDMTGAPRNTYPNFSVDVNTGRNV